MKTIVMKFSEPLQSWGTGSNFETRHTDFYPSKSAVIGMISAGFGYRRDDDIAIRRLNELSFGVRIDQRGSLLRDYHIAQKYKINGNFERTYVTNRYYIEDAVFIVAISHEDDSFMEEIYKALEYPYFQHFMGRRSLPLGYDFIQGMFDNDIVNCLESHEWMASSWYKKKYRNDKFVGLEIYADSDLIDDNSHILRKDRPISFSQKNRRFGFRYESRKWVHVVNDRYVESDSKHDVFGAV